MQRASRLFVAALALANVRGSCGGEGCPVEPMPAPMTEARARQLDPEVVTGLALSTTHVYGDCRPIAAPAEGQTGECMFTSNTACARERGPHRVFVLEVNQSVPLDPACDGRFSVEDLSAIAEIDAHASEEGELVVPLPAGHYTVYVSVDERCAQCGIIEGNVSCRVEVVRNAVAARDVVIDEATH